MLTPTARIILVLAVATSAPIVNANADPIRTAVTIGGANSSNAFPFGAGPDEGFEYRGLYQQIYAAEAFRGSLAIDRVAFQTESGNEPGVVASSFTLSLGTTSSSPLDPLPSYAGNRRADLSQVFEGTVTAATQGSGTFNFVIPLSRPFAYDTARGHLLLEVFIRQDLTPNVFFVSGHSDVTGRVFNFGGTGAARADGGNGLRTQFAGTLETTAPVPEPSTLLLLASGTVLVCRAARRRRTSAN